MKPAYSLFPALLLILAGCHSRPEPESLLAGFVSIADVDPTIQLDIRYYSDNNFMGRPVKGYLAPACLLSEPAAQALITAQQQALGLGYSLKVYDCYRPQQAVNDFLNWAADPDDTFQQQRFYPQVPKAELFARGYIAERSGHSRGSTLDMTLVPVGSRQPSARPDPDRFDCRLDRSRRFPDNSVEMGTGYDCFDELSHTDNPDISGAARSNRDLLRELMKAAGFSNYAQEWWHFTLDGEPYPDSYFNFPVDFPAR
ncbi:MAG: M15 family metallopeptidase [Gammaproteobacteria bacterium]|nr:M15 family metallopeptidase [Pseudomonadales bacterium]MCP5348220.1 M15 family metallopeptidase [Pseudomonadales bacterium]